MIFVLSGDTNSTGYPNPKLNCTDTMADKLMYIPNDDTQNKPFCRLKIVVETFEHSTYNAPTNQNLPKSTKLLSQPIRKLYLKTL